MVGQGVHCELVLPQSTLMPVPLGVGMLPGLEPPVLECVEKDHVEPDHV